MIRRTEILRASPQDTQRCWEIYRDKSPSAIRRGLFDQMVEEACQRKAPMARALGMPADGRLYHVFQPEAEDLENHHVIKMVGEMIPITPGEFLAGYKEIAGRKFRIHKAAQKLLRDAGYDIDTNMLVVTKAIQVAASLRPRLAVLSANPVDQLLASELAPGWDGSDGSGSCFRVKGQYANVTIQMARSTRVLMIYTVAMTPEEQRSGIIDTYQDPPWFRDKIARLWVHLPGFQQEDRDYNVVWIARNYGAMPEPVVDRMGDFLCERLGLWAGKVSRRWQSRGDTPNVSGAIYVDRHVSYLRSIAVPAKGSGIQRLSKAMCLVCGDKHTDEWDSDKSTGQCCEECSGYEENLRHCIECNTRLYDDDMQSYCNDCGTTCDNCGAETSNQDITHTRDGCDVCPRCLRRGYTQCEQCEEFASDSKVQSYTLERSCNQRETSNICDECADNLTECNGCRVLLTREADHAPLCTACHDTEVDAEVEENESR